MKLISSLLLLTALSPALSGKEVGRAKEEVIAPGVVKMDINAIYLLDRKSHKHHAVKASRPLLPHRVYMRYDLDLHMWVFVLSDFTGKIPEPLEALRPGTVAPGSVIGADLALQRFVLKEDGTWLPTREPESYRLWVKGNPPELKRIDYVRLPAESPGPLRHVPPKIISPKISPESE